MSGDGQQMYAQVPLVTETLVFLLALLSRVYAALVRSAPLSMGSENVAPSVASSSLSRPCTPFAHAVPLE